MNSILDIPGASGISPRDAAESKGKYQLDPVTQLLADYITKQEAQQKALQAAQNPALNKSVLEEAVEKTVGGMMGGALGALQGAMPQMGAPAPQGMPPAPQGMPPAQGGVGGLDFAPTQMADGGIVGYAAGDPVMATESARRLSEAGDPVMAKESARRLSEAIERRLGGAFGNIDFTDPENVAILEQFRAEEERRLEEEERRLAEQEEEAKRLETQAQARQKYGEAGGRNFSGSATPAPSDVPSSIDDILGSTSQGMSRGLDNLREAVGSQGMPSGSPTPAPAAPAPFGAPGASAPQGLPGFSVSEELDKFGFPVTSTASKALLMTNPEGESPFAGVMEASQKVIDGMSDEYAPVAASMANILQTLKDKNTPEAIKRRREKDLALGLAEFGFRLASTGKIGESALGTMSELKKTLEGREGEQLADLARIAEVQGARADIVLKPLMQGFQTSLAEAGMKQDEIDNKLQVFLKAMDLEAAGLRALRAAARKPPEYTPDDKGAAEYADEQLNRLITVSRDAKSFNEMIESLALPQSVISSVQPFAEVIFTQKGKDSEATREAQEQFRELMKKWYLFDRAKTWRDAQQYRM